jgi:cellulose synthase/poly-beta-1,6-N-acetylglucosamine synthase-like glycosyltransferase
MTRKNITERARRVEPAATPHRSQTIAVCIPLHAAHIKYLDRCLRSIKAQTRRPDQIHISVSSCEPPHIAEINRITFNLKMFVKLQIFREPLLAGGNRNRAAAAAVRDGATILSFFDADDVMHPRRIEILAGHFEKNPDITGIMNCFIFGPKEDLGLDLSTIPWRPLTNIIHNNAFEYIKREGMFRMFYLKMEVQANSKVKGVSFVACAAITVRAEFWKGHQYSETIVLGEDQDYNSQVIEAGENLAYIPDTLSVYMTGEREEFDCICSKCDAQIPDNTDPKLTIVSSLENMRKKRDELYQRNQLIRKRIEELKENMRSIHPDSDAAPQ